MPKDKKSKKSKKKELEEKRLQEQELLRQQQEEERKRQEELEQKRKEEEEERRIFEEKRRQEEIIRLAKEKEDDTLILAKRAKDIEKLLTSQKEQKEWKQHLNCSDLPDVSDQRQLNDFLTTWTDPLVTQKTKPKNPIGILLSIYFIFIYFFFRLNAFFF